MSRRAVRVGLLALVPTLSLFAVVRCASAVSIRNVTTNTTLFADDFESGSFTPSVGSENAGPDVTVTTSTAAPDPGPFSGTHYVKLFRDSNTNGQGNLFATTSSPQTNGGDVILMRMMVYIPAASDADARAQLILDDGDFNSARAWARPDGNGHVVAGTPSGFVDTGLTYATDTWQEWDLQYEIQATAFSITVNGSTRIRIPSFAGRGAVSHADLFNGVASPGGTFYLDDVPEPAIGLAGSLVLSANAMMRRRNEHKDR